MPVDQTNATRSSAETVKGLPLNIVPLTAAHWPRVRAIYEEGIPLGLTTFETAAPEWDEWDRTHLPVCRYVVELDGTIVGWSALSAISHRSCYAGVADVSVYVA